MPTSAPIEDDGDTALKLDDFLGGLLFLDASLLLASEKTLSSATRSDDDEEEEPAASLAKMSIISACDEDVGSLTPSCVSVKGECACAEMNKTHSFIVVDVQRSQLETYRMAFSQSCGRRSMRGT